MSEVRRNVIGSFIDGGFDRPFDRFTFSVKIKLRIILMLSGFFVIISFVSEIICNSLRKKSLSFMGE